MGWGKKEIGTKNEKKKERRSELASGWVEEKKS